MVDRKIGLMFLSQGKRPVAVLSQQTNMIKLVRTSLME